MITMLATIFVFGVIVFIHELGHFVTAKACGMRVDEFAVGFGPAIVKVQKDETLYSIRAIPLGGYNKIAGMSDEEELDDRSFLNKPAWQRFIVISAGAVFNFLLAILIVFSILVISGAPSPSSEPVIGRMHSTGPAAIAHLEVNDKITSINGKKITKWTDIAIALQGTQKHAIPIVVERNGQMIESTIIPMETDNGRAIIGINPSSIMTKYPIGEAAYRAVAYTVNMVHQMITSLWSMIVGTEEAQLAGPVGVAQMAGEVAQIGFVYLLQFTAILSINLGVINLLPLPVLDGGHLIIILVESITRRKLPPKALQYIQMAGLALLLFIFLYTTVQDISRI